MSSLNELLPQGKQCIIQTVNCNTVSEDLDYSQEDFFDAEGNLYWQSFNYKITFRGENLNINVWKINHSFDITDTYRVYTTGAAVEIINRFMCSIDFPAALSMIASHRNESMKMNFPHFLPIDIEVKPLFYNGTPSVFSLANMNMDNIDEEQYAYSLLFIKRLNNQINQYFGIDNR